jgi:hypothetical protein
MRFSFVRTLLVALVVLAGAAAGARAQVGSTTDIITGKVTDTTGRPINGATVTATSLETRVSRSRTTGPDGKYTILFPDGGGSYRLTVRAIGVAPQTANVSRQGDEDRLERSFRMTVNAAPQSLTAVTVQARRAPGGGVERPAPGGSERTFSADQQSRLPVDANDVNTLAALAPGVVGVGSTDSTTASFSVAGQRTTANNITLDGISFGSGSVPQEAVRGTRVITSTYDVARGQFTGGQIATTTRSGTNVVQGSATFNMRDPSLQWTPAVNSSFGQGYNQATFSAGIGGPIIEDQLFYFGAVQWRQQLNPIQTITSADSLSLVRLGLAPDSVSRFLGQLSSYGLPVTVNGIPGRRTNNNLTGIARIDYNLSDEHTLTLRGDYRWAEQDASRIGSYSTPSHGGSSGSTGGGLQVTLTSRFGSFVHEAKGYFATNNQDADPYVTYPEGRVRLSSQLPDGTTSVTSLTFGANPGLPNVGSGRSFEGTDELSWISDDGAHRVKLGALYNWAENDQNSGINRYGSFTYNTLADFLNNQPAIFTRTLGDQRTTGSSVNSALYLGDVWRISRSLQLTYGVRGEYSTYAGAPARNAGIDSTFGLRTDRWAAETHVSPRIGFTYTIFADSNSGSQGPIWFIRGGFGEFRGRAPSNLFTAAQQGNGLGTGLVSLTCLGTSAPIPSWASLANGGTAIPNACAAGGTSTTSLSTPAVTAFANDFEAPRSWRGNLSLTRRFWERWTAAVDAQYAWGDALYGVQDVNLNTTPKFTLADEGRPVFVPATSIAPTTGFTTIAASRVNPAFAQVYKIGSQLNSKTAQVTASLNAFTDKGIALNLSYTYQRAWDQSSWSFGPPLFGFGGPTTAANPNQNEWAASDLERRHNVVGTITWPLNPSLEVTFIGRLTSGGHYSPLVGSDINGDGSRNDRAYVYNPASAPDTALANGMSRLLAKTSGEARSCLLRQVGSIASRNSCDQPWFPSLDMQLNWRPDAWGLQRRLALSLSFINPLAGLDQLINGEKNLQGWGQQPFVDNTLLYVRGFDPVAGRYKYEVNERFGNAISGAQVNRSPFLLQLQARFTYGMNTTQERMGFAMGGFGGGPPGGGAGGGGGGPMGMLNNSRVMNPLAQLVEMKDSLKLTDAQLTQVKQLSDSLAARSQRLGDEIRALVAKAGNNPDPAIVFSSIRPKLEEGRRNVTDAVKAAQAVLTPDQWKLVPDSVKNPFANMFGGQQGQQRRPGEQRP